MIKKFNILLVIFAMTFSGLNAQFIEQEIFSGNSDSNFGQSVAVNNDYILVGSPMDDVNGAGSGSATFIKKDGISWTETFVTPADNEADDRFGGNIAMDGNWAVISASFDDDNGDGSGAVYIYNFDGTSWNYHSKIIGDDTDADDNFGAAVAIKGTKIVVGADYKQEGGPYGAAYLFEFDGTDWTQTQRLTPDDPSICKSYGYEVAISDDYIVVGNPEDNSLEGTVVIFESDGSNWSQCQLLTPPVKVWNFYGADLAIKNDLLVIGAFMANNSGEAYTYRLNSGIWEYEQTFAPENVGNSDNFSNAIAIGENILLIGADNYEPNDVQGAVFKYIYDGSSWSSEEIILGSDIDNNSNFGNTIAISGDRLVVGNSSQDKIYLFEQNVTEIDTFYVTPTGAGDLSGISWENAYAGAVDDDGNGYSDLQDLINTIENGKQIWVAAGTYKPTTGTDRTKYFSLRNEIKLFGGFAGTETSVSERNWQTNKTILSGDIDNNDNLNADGICETYSDIVGSNSYSVMVNHHAEQTAIIDGFYFTGGYSDGSYPQNCGAAMRNFGASDNNHFDHDRYASPTVRNCDFQGNYSTYGAIVHNIGNYGDEISIGFSEPIFRNCTIKNNYGLGMIISANAYGNANVDIDSCKFINNLGGALTVDRGNANEEVYGTIHNSVFQGNNGGTYGGAIFTDGTILEYKNCLFTGNTAEFGGAIYTAGDYYWCVPIFMNCTFAANKSTSSDVQSNVLYNFGADVNFVNCNFFGNKEGVVNTANFMGYGTTFYQNCNIQGSGGSGDWQFGQHDIDNGGNIDQDPLFVDLPDFNNAPTVEGDFHLQTGTPLVDLGMTGTFSYTYGSSTTTSDAPTIDLDGNPRIGNPDLGVYEYTGVLPEYTVNFSVVNGNGTLEATVNSSAITSGDQITQGSSIEFTATPDANYEIFEWIVNDVVQAETGNTFVYDNLQENINVTVEFQFVDNIAENSNKISIYPNPTNGIVTINGTDAMHSVSKVEITDITGKQIQGLTSPLRGDREGLLLDLSELENGVYLIKIKTKAEIYTHKILKY